MQFPLNVRSAGVVSVLTVPRVAVALLCAVQFAALQLPWKHTAGGRLAGSAMFFTTPPNANARAAFF
jgi:hypothetical protein